MNISLNSELMGFTNCNFAQDIQGIKYDQLIGMSNAIFTVLTLCLQSQKGMQICLQFVPEAIIFS